MIRTGAFKHFIGLLLTCWVLGCVLWMRTRLDYNGAYIDEADYLFVGHRLLHDLPWNTHVYVFSSDLPLYMLGYAAQYGDLLGARWWCAVLGLISLGFYYHAVHRVCTQPKVALIATALLAVSACHAFISKFAVYDVICFFWFSAGLSAISLAWYSQALRAQCWMIAASFLFLLSFLSKYIIILEFPLIAFWVLRYRPQLFIALALPCALAMLGYTYWHWSDLQILWKTQVLQSHQKAQHTTWSVLMTQLSYIWPVMLLWMAAAWPLTRKQPMMWFVASCSLALPMMVYHLYSGDLISVYKHMVYPITFAAPMAAYVWVQWYQSTHLHYILLCAISLLSVGLHGLWMVDKMERGYPDHRRVLAHLQPLISANSTVFSEDPYAMRYGLRHQLKPVYLFETGYFDNNGDQKRTKQDVIDAVAEGKFEFIYLDGRSTPLTTQALKEWPLRQHYQLIYAQPYQTSTVMFDSTTGVMQLYQRRGNYTGLYPVPIKDDAP